jgi:hypothetical protein
LRALDRFVTVRLSPKSVFFGLLTLGLPFAMTVGWNLATPTPAPSAADRPAGTGALGSAPVRTTAAVPDTVIRWVTPPVATPTAPAAAPVLPAAPPPRTAGAAPTAATSAAPVSPPALTNPPVPTPTMITFLPPPPQPSPTPTTAAPEPSATDPEAPPQP